MMIGFLVTTLDKRQIVGFKDLPFLTLTSLTTDIEHAICQRTKVKDSFDNACCLDAASYDIAIRWYIVYSKESIQIMIKAKEDSSE